MNKHLFNIEITDGESLLRACDLLHDARFDMSTLQVDEAAGTWNGRFEREFFEDPALIKQERHIFIFKKTTFPVTDCELHLRGIKSCVIKDKSEIGIYTFMECSLNGYVATLSFCEDMIMTLEFHDVPRGRMVDHKLLSGRKSYMCGFWGSG